VRFHPRIETLEAEHVRPEAAVRSPDFYKEGADAIAQTLDRMSAWSRSCSKAYSRADEIEEGGLGN
jgi:hypothetical protein